MSKTNLIFKAWVPNVAGRLSFRVIGDSLQPSRCTHENETIGGRGRVVATQARSLDDSLWLPPFKSWLLNNTTKHFFILCGDWTSNEASDSDMTGCVAMIPWPAHGELEKLAQQAMKEWRDCVKNGASTSRLAYDTLLSKIETTPYLAKYKLTRSGELTLNLKKLPEKEYDQIAETESKRREHELAAELYFFVRDISHLHKHHSAASDRILDVVRVDSESNESWIKQVFAELRRHSIDMRRGRRSQIGDPSGFLAYAESFKLICDRKQGAASSRFNQFTEVHFSPIRASIEARHQMEQEYQQRVSSRSSGIHETFISAAAIALSVVALLQLQPDDFKAAIVSSNLICAGFSLLKNTEFWASFFLYLLATAQLIARGYLTKPYLKFGLWFMRLAHAFPRSFVSGVFISLSFATSGGVLLYLTNTNPIFSSVDWKACVAEHDKKMKERVEERRKINLIAPAAPAAQTTLNPQAAWPFPTASKP